jgi:hypothetical protein
MFTDTINKCAATAERIVKLDRQNPFATGGSQSAAVTRSVHNLHFHSITLILN